MKSGIDYFPLDVTLDSKLDLIEAEFGVTGFGVVVHLLQEIYGQEGYYIEWTEEVALLFARKYGLGDSVVSEILAASIKRGMFDQKIYDKYHILTSRGIQKRYFEAVSRRKVLEVDYNILLVDADLLPKNADIKRKNVNIYSKNADNSEQSKVEESRAKKSKVKNKADKPPHTRFSTPTLEEVKEYVRERNSTVDPQKFFDYFSAGNWIDSKGQPVRNWKQKLITWEGKRQTASPPDNKPQEQRIRLFTPQEERQPAYDLSKYVEWPPGSNNYVHEDELERLRANGKA